MLKLSLPLYCAPSTASVLLQHLYTSRTATNLSVPSCTVATSSVPLALLQPSLRCLRLLHSSTLCCSICIRFYRHPPSCYCHFGAPVDRYDPRVWVPQEYCPSSPIVLLRTARCLPTSTQVACVHSWHNHRLSKLPSLPVLSLP